MERLSVYVADDQTLFREGMTALFRIIERISFTKLACETP